MPKLTHEVVESTESLFSFPTSAYIPILRFWCPYRTQAKFLVECKIWPSSAATLSRQNQGHHTSHQSWRSGIYLAQIWYDLGFGAFYHCSGHTRYKAQSNQGHFDLIWFDFFDTIMCTKIPVCPHVSASTLISITSHQEGNDVNLMCLTDLLPACNPGLGWCLTWASLRSFKNVPLSSGQQTW